MAQNYRIDLHHIMHETLYIIQCTKRSRL